MVAISLAEGETLRWMLHTRQAVLTGVGLALRTVGGRVMDAGPQFAPPSGNAVPIALLCMRFFNCEMFYTDDELELLEEGLRAAGLEVRQAFFKECLRLRCTPTRTQSCRPYPPSRRPAAGGAAEGCRGLRRGGLGEGCRGSHRLGSN